MNIIKFNKKIYRYESYWRNKKNIKITDSEDKALPWPRPGIKWQMRDSFLQKLHDTEMYLRRKNKFKKYEKEKYKDCLICGQKSITTGIFELNKIRWEDGLMHYMKKHNTKPSDKFIDIIFRHQIGPKIFRTQKSTKLKGVKIVKYNKTYLKLERNQILIMDALMKHGSYKRYIDPDDRTIFRYSEHAGILDFNNQGLERVVVSGNTSRIDINDDDIYLPTNMLDMFDYEYIFHTHPPTGGLGGRAIDGILYEFPSIGDIFHFIDHFNKGNTQGSIVITPEGMYIIRKLKHNNKKIRINDDKFYKQFYNIHKNIQKDAIKKYGIKFNSRLFYNKIAQDLTYINKLNDVMKKFHMYIDYYSRVKDKKNRWVIDTVYIPIYVVEPK